MQSSNENPQIEGHTSRRNFLTNVALTMGAAGIGMASWGLIKTLQPSADVNAKSGILKVDLQTIPSGKQMLLRLDGAPLYIRHRTNEQIFAAQEADRTYLRDRFANNYNLKKTALATNKNRSVPDNNKFIVVEAVCTKSRCVVTVEFAGAFGGWFCPCCAAHYDIAGRVRRGPAPRNLFIPRYSFLSPNVLQIFPRRLGPAESIYWNHSPSG